MVNVAFISHQILVAYSQGNAWKLKGRIDNQILGIKFVSSIYHK